MLYTHVNLVRRKGRGKEKRKSVISTEITRTLLEIT